MNVLRGAGPCLANRQELAVMRYHQAQADFTPQYGLNRGCWVALDIVVDGDPFAYQLLRLSEDVACLGCKCSVRSHRAWRQQQGKYSAGKRKVTRELGKGKKKIVSSIIILLSLFWCQIPRRLCGRSWVIRVEVTHVTAVITCSVRSKSWPGNEGDAWGIKVTRNGRS